MRALLNTNVIVDVLQHREPWCADGEALFLAVADDRIEGCITAKQAADIHYFARRQFKGQPNADALARQVLAKLLSLFELIDTLAADCRQALSIANPDYEDALMMETARRSGVDCIVTRNPKDFRDTPVPVLAPDEALRRI